MLNVPRHLKKVHQWNSTRARNYKWQLSFRSEERPFTACPVEHCNHRGKRLNKHLNSKFHGSLSKEARSLYIRLAKQTQVISSIYKYQFVFCVVFFVFAGYFVKKLFGLLSLFLLRSNAIRYYPSCYHVCVLLIF